MHARRPPYALILALLVTLAGCAQDEPRNERDGDEDEDERTAPITFPDSIDAEQRYA